ncbi:N-6 DNA methylase [Candidatus Poribacteria bacterium]|nr:N-6 DNA methylase [Candidatus Poribacteria bacterium]
MNFQRHCKRYLQQIDQTRSDPNATPELSFHPHLHEFFVNVSTDPECFNRSSIAFTNEPRSINQIGRPDFISSDGLLTVGYIEAEEYSTDLNNLTGHAREQNERFIENLDNFILTNFVDFQLWKDGQLRASAHIEHETENLETLLELFLNAGHVQITSPETLANYLARRTRELQKQIATTLTNENSETYRMFNAFKETLLATLTPDDFSDMYAQTLTYGLFAARCTLPNGTNFSRHTAVGTLPRSNPFLVQLFYHVASPNLEENVTFILDDIATLLQNVSTEMLRTAFSANNHLEDPVIHFYETFLKEYNPQLRFDRGVFYTPPQVISYIVRSVDSLLKTELNRPDGLADDNTLILDPATGTGGFLLSVLAHIREHVTTNYGTGDWTRYINAQLVKRMFGFELLVAPYTIAHLKLSMFLQTQGWNTNERLGIYLTNTLEQPEEMQAPLPFAEFISDEANAALSVKRDEPILAILGNPPYKQHSANPSRVAGRLTFIGNLIEDYKQVDGEPLDEINPRALQDDYVKFIRWAQWRIGRTGEGVIGYIVNNNFLDAPTARGMRQNLLNSFNTIYVINLHGSNRRTEAAPTGQTDENVFDIIQGVCIMLCMKQRNNSSFARIYHADMWGSREQKYRILMETDVQSTEWCELHPESSNYLFVPQGTDYRAEYDDGWKITDIFQTSSIGIVTARDKLTIHRTDDEVRNTVSDFVSLPVEEARERYNLGGDSRDWQVHLAQSDLRNHSNADQHIAPIHYRPFDTRWTYYTGQSRGFHCMPRPTNIPNLLHDNFALCVCRIVKSPIWQHALITDKITDNCYISNTTSESSHVFPLYLYPNSEGLGLDTERELNFQPEFLTALSEALGLPQTPPFGLPEDVTPEEILAYIYAVLYSPTYRERYYEFLKYDFPRIPLPKDINHFRNLASLGQELINWHLVKDVQIPHHHRFEGEGNAVVTEFRYEDGSVWINNTQYFTNVSEAVWKYEIGAYQVCEKWLKDRRGETLSHVEIRLYPMILVAITETLRVVDAIDEVVEF